MALRVLFATPVELHRLQLRHLVEQVGERHDVALQSNIRLAGASDDRAISILGAVGRAKSHLNVAQHLQLLAGAGGADDDVDGAEHE